jgi:hypothetical protein
MISDDDAVQRALFPADAPEADFHCHVLLVRKIVLCCARLLAIPDGPERTW